MLFFGFAIRHLRPRPLPAQRTVTISTNSAHCDCPEKSGINEFSPAAIVVDEDAALVPVRERAARGSASRRDGWFVCAGEMNHSEIWERSRRMHNLQSLLESKAATHIHTHARNLG